MSKTRRDIKSADPLKRKGFFEGDPNRLQDERIKSAQIIKSCYFPNPAGGGDCDLALGYGSLRDICKSTHMLGKMNREIGADQTADVCQIGEITGLACSSGKTLGKCCFMNGCVYSWTTIFHLITSKDVMLFEDIELVCHF